MPHQLSLDLPARTAHARQDFLVAPSNALAVAMIDAWPGWTQRKLVVTGPPGSGKTHLAHVWASRAGATVLQAKDLVASDVPQQAAGPVVVEDVPQIAGDGDQETALFHLHNLVLENGHALMCTGEAPVSAWRLELQDLKSRLQGATHARLEAPDDTLLAAVLAKQFSDHQIVPKSDVIPYLVAHMDRSFDMARRLVEALNRESLARQRGVTRPLAASVLENLQT